jgi:tripartite-type tricarboxylate transporter receptor subunit TctC
MKTTLLRMSKRIPAAGGFIVGCAATAVLAQAYPVKPVRVIAGFPPASAADITARVIGAKLGDALGHQILVENRPGAGSSIAAEVAAKSPPDGYTLFILTAANAINSGLARLPFDIANDFAPITLATAVPNILAVHPSVPARSVKELIALAKASPGRLNYASSGPGTVPHLSAELFGAMAGLTMTHVPYKGSPQAVTDLIAGQVALMFSPSSTVLPHLGGRLRALAVTTPYRLPSLPDLPTVAESGLPGFETSIWFGYAAPARTPQPIVTRLNAEIVKILGLPDVRQQFAAQAIEVRGSTPGEFGAYIREELAKWAKVIKLSGAKAE